MAMYDITDINHLQPFINIYSSLNINLLTNKFKTYFYICKMFIVFLGQYKFIVCT